MTQLNLLLAPPLLRNIYVQVQVTIISDSIPPSFLLASRNAIACFSATVIAPLPLQLLRNRDRSRKIRTQDRMDVEVNLDPAVLEVEEWRMGPVFIGRRSSGGAELGLEDVCEGL